MSKIKFILKGLHITPDFKKKLEQNFHGLTVLEMVIYLIFIRWFWSKEKRFFFEGSFKLLGQMYIADRKALYDAILEYKPEQCFEVGTYTGGGSTYFLAKAFEKLGKGKLITMESVPYYFEKARNYYANHLPTTAPFVEFILGSSASAFDSRLLPGGIDCVFFDGAEDGKETLDQYNYFLPHFKTGTIIMMHDWNTEKMIDLKPLITNDKEWEIVKVIAPPQSVGFAIAKKK